MKPLSIKEIILIHLTVLEKKRLDAGDIYPELLKPVQHAIFGKATNGIPHYSSLFQRAAGFIIEMGQKQKPFGLYNEETALMCADVYLQLNDYDLHLEDPKAFLEWAKEKTAQEIGLEISKHSTLIVATKE